MIHIRRDINDDDPIFQALEKASESEGVNLTDRLMENLAEGVRSRGKAKLTPAQAKKIVSAAGNEVKRASVDPFEAVGIVTAQSIGEPGTQNDHANIPLCRCSDGQRDSRFASNYRNRRCTQDTGYTYHEHLC